MVRANNRDSVKIESERTCDIRLLELISGLYKLTNIEAIEIGLVAPVKASVLLDIAPSYL